MPRRETAAAVTRDPDLRRSRQPGCCTAPRPASRSRVGVRDSQLVQGGLAGPAPGHQVQQGIGFLAEGLQNACGRLGGHSCVLCELDGPEFDYTRSGRHRGLAHGRQDGPDRDRLPAPAGAALRVGDRAVGGSHPYPDRAVRGRRAIVPVFELAGGLGIWLAGRGHAGADRGLPVLVLGHRGTPSGRIPRSRQKTESRTARESLGPLSFITAPAWAVAARKRACVAASAHQGNVAKPPGPGG
jgi:hypothetical protein